MKVSSVERQSMDDMEPSLDSISPIKSKLVTTHILNTLNEWKNGPNEGNFLGTSKWIARNLFWSVIYIIGGFLTATICHKILQDYARNPTAVNMKTSGIDEFPMPSITVCMALDPARMFPLQDVSSSLPYSSAMRKFFESNAKNWWFQFQNQLAESNEAVSNEVLYVLQKYLAILYEMETMGGKILPRNSNESSFESLEALTGDLHEALYHIFLPKIAELSISIDQIKSVFIEHFKRFGKCGSELNLQKNGKCSNFFEVSYQKNGQWIYENANSESIAFWNRYEICFKTREYKLNSHDKIEGESYDVGITINDNRGLTNGDHLGLILIDFNGINTPSDSRNLGQHERIYMIRMDETASQSIGLQSIYRSLPMASSSGNGTYRCSMEGTRQDCEKNCRKSLIKAFCGCASPTYPTDTSDGNVCTLDVYKKCLFDHQPQMGSSAESCKSNCLDNCEQRQYKISHPVIKRTPNNDATRLQISIAKFDYFVFEEYYPWTMDKLVPAIGGVLGIWLGLDLVVLIGFLFNPIMLIIGKVLAIISADNETNLTNKKLSAEGTILTKISTFMEISGPTYNTWPFIIKWLSERAFWIVIYVIGGLCTAAFCLAICLKYLSEPVSSDISVTLTMNQSFSLPAATLCVPYFPQEIDSPNAKIVPLQWASREEFMGLDDASPVWTLKDIDSIYNHLEILYHAETFGLGKPMIQKSDRPRIDDHLEAFDKIFTPKLTKWQVTTDELRQKLGFELNRLVGLRVHFVDSKLVPLYIKATRIMVISKLGFCLHLPLDTLNFTSKNDYIEIGFNPIAENSDSVLDFNAPLAEDSFDRLKYKNDDEAVYGMSKGVSKSLFLRVNHVSKMGPEAIRSEKCSNEEKQDVCRARQRIKLIEHLCDCSPTSWPTLLTSPMKKECDWEYKNCFLRYNGTEGVANPQKCAPNCVRHYFDSFEIPEKTNDENHDWNSSTTLLRIKVVDFAYPILEEKPAQNFRSFIASLGGALGIFLGLDMRHLAWIIFTPVFMIISLMLRGMQGSDLRKNKTFLLVLQSHRMRRISYLLGIDHTRVMRLSPSAVVKKAFENTVWFVVYLAGGIVTLYYIIDFAKLYGKEELHTHIQLITNKSIVLPALTICMPLRALQVDNYQRDEYNVHLDLIQNASFAEDKSYVLVEKWDFILLQIVHRYISEHRMYEMLEREMDSESAFLDKMDVQMKLLNISMEQLIQKFTEELLTTVYLVEVELYPNSIQIIPINGIEKITYVDKLKICLNFKSNVELFSTNDMIRVRIMARDSSSWLFNTNNSVDQRHLNESNYTDLEGNFTGIESNFIDLSCNFTDVEENFDLSCNSTYLEGYFLHLRCNITNMETNNIDLEGNFIYLSCNASDLEGNPIDLSCNFTDLGGNFTDMEGNFTNLKCNFTGLGHNFTDLASNYTDLEENFTSIESNFIDLSCNFTDVEENFDLSCNSTYLEGYFLHLRCNITDMETNNTDLEDNFIDLSCNATDVEGNSIDLRCNFTDLASNFTDTEGNFTNLRCNFTDFGSNYTNLESNFTDIGSNFTDFGSNFTHPEEGTDLERFNASKSTDIGSVTIAFDIGDVNYEANIFDASIPLQFGKVSIAEVEISRVNHYLPIFNGKQRCSMWQSQDECRDSCRVQGILSQCGCVPQVLKATASNQPSNSNLSTNKTPCTLRNYQECSITRDGPYYDTLVCFNGCLEPCEKKRYNGEIKSLPTFFYETQHTGTQAELFLRVKSFTYQSVEEFQSYYTIFDMCVDGGAIFIWIGINCLVLINLICRFIARVNRMCCVNKSWAQVHELSEKSDLYRIDADHASIEKMKPTFFEDT